MSTFKMNESLNQQVMMEFESYWIYRGMALWASEQSWNGFADWLRLQAEEEREHAERLVEAVLTRNGTVCLAEIPAPNRNWTSLEEVFAEAPAHEKSDRFNRTADCRGDEHRRPGYGSDSRLVR